MKGIVSQLVEDIALPKMIRVRQVFPRPKIEVEDIPATILNAFSGEAFSACVRSGMRIAVTAGSRGIANVALITKTIVDFCIEKGAHPFVVPAMGSHGGATAQGQLEILKSYGITEDYLGCPIHSSMETKLIGYTEEGQPVLIDKYAAEADGIIVSCRVKPHTSFRGPYESGIMKMMTIGLGKQRGADICHSTGFGRMAHYVPLFGKAILKNANILFALASIENAFDETYRLEAVMPEDIEAVEPGLLCDAFAHMPRILFDECDVLVVDRIGKNYSGDGMDPNITGTFCTPYASGGIKAQKVAVLGLSEETQGNANGIGMADATTKRVFADMDFEKTYPNAITAKTLQSAKLPMVMQSDKEAIGVCLRVCDDIDWKNPRIVRIANSLHLEYILVSEAMAQEARENPQLVIESEAAALEFDAFGNLL